MDALGRRKEVHDPRGNVWHYRYDDRDRLTEIALPGPDTPTITYTWDRNDQLERVKDPTGKVTRYTYNDDLQLIKTLDPAGSATGYDYDTFGNLKTLTNAFNQPTTYTYDTLNRLRSVAYPGGDNEAYDYDAIGNLLTWKKGDSSTVTYGYDDANRLTSMRHSSVGTITYGYDVLSRRTSMQDPTGTTRWTYNDNSQVLTQAVPRLGTLRFTYDRLNRLETLRDPQNQLTTYSWTDRNLMKSGSLDGQTVTYGYDSAGNLTSTVYPNGVALNQTFDGRNQLDQMEYVKGLSEPVLTLNYDYNKAGHVTRLTRNESSGSTRILKYDYDPRYELTQVQEKINTAPLAVKETYGYDGNRNRTSANGQSFFYNTADQLTGGTASASYNSNGAVTSLTLPGQGARSFTYN
ncbi:MAG: RHS repeat protein [Armatimonadetes bacterium]|nr:RHS repeat protein [Armatimonadota bacterium]